VRAALSHQLPAASLDQVIHHCLQSTLEHCQKRQRGSGQATQAKAPAKGSRYIPAAVRDEVWRREEGRCSFVGTTGHRCDSTYQLQVHHITAFARGGEATVANLARFCSSHNGYQARQDFGAQAALF
jgi:5-methylcytosine-specific restriction endonuclease McrA